VSFKKILQSFSRRYTHFVQRQGFAVLSVLCVAIIVGSAVWTKHNTTPLPAPTPPVNSAALAAQLWQQSLSEATTPSPSPTDAPVTWSLPLTDIHVLQNFDGIRMIQSAVTGIWQLHDAVDLAASPGTPVSAMADGVVVSIEEKGMDRARVTIAHADGYEVTFSGLAMLAGIQPGDPVKAGQTLGFSRRSP